MTAAVTVICARIAALIRDSLVVLSRPVMHAYSLMRYVSYYYT